MTPEAAILAFTRRGLGLATRLSGLLAAPGSDMRVEVLRVTDLQAEVKPLFGDKDLLVFIGAVGIAVRAIAPYLRSKTSDPAVVVIDEAGRFAVPILSGHIGGANRFASRIAGLIGATAVISTASDVNGVFSFDAFAAERGYVVLNPEAIKPVTAALLDGRPVGLASELPIDGGLPDSVYLADQGEIGVCISLDAGRQPFRQTLRLLPRCYHVGIGSRRGVDPEGLSKFFYETLADLSLPPVAVATLSSIDLKANEPAIVALAEQLRIPFICYSADQLNSVADRFQQSARVLAATQTGNVSEAAAYLSSGQGEMVWPKTARDGATIAVARESWRISFEAIDDRT